ncbi:MULTISPECIES: hypothetical protein [Gammaproteobacteria]|nr:MULTISPECIES: hypothetical protein [Gammaproteobacteria]HCH3682920.1 hypothetical protein [Vibrio parahaemolyticus]
MEIVQIFSESLISSFPAFLILAFSVVCVKALMRQYLEMKEKYEYKSDRYRQDIEVRISELTQEIQSSKKRFESVNHLVLDGNTSKNGVLSQLGINLSGVETRPNSVFVLTPFNSRFDDDYQTVRDFFVDHGYQCNRGDDVKVTHNVLGHIIKEMASAELVVANISGRNPNVFYELGIAHALGKEVIIIAQNSKDITFDVSQGQVVIYKDSNHLRESLNKWLVSILKNK